MISYYFMGLASEAELIAHLEKLKRHDQRTNKDRSGSVAFNALLR
jgi:hypothetical protein